MKDELGGKIMNEFVGLTSKTYSYLKDNNDDDKKAKRTKKYVIKRKLKFQGYKNCLEAAQIETYAHGTSEDLICKKEEIKRNNIIKKYKNVQL